MCILKAVFRPGSRFHLYTGSPSYGPTPPIDVRSFAWPLLLLTVSLQHLQAAALDSALLKTEHKGQLITLCIRDDEQPPAPRRGGHCRQGIGGELHVLPPELYEEPGFRRNLQQQGHDDLHGRPQGFPPSSREVPLQRRGLQVPTALHQERPRDRLGER